MSSYPLGQSEADTITSRTGKKLSQITLDEVTMGACYAAMEENGATACKDTLYLSDDMIQHNLGMWMEIRGQEGYYPLVNAGINWYMARHTCEFLLGDEKEVVIYSRTVRGEEMEHTLALSQLPDRPRRATRLRLDISFTAPDPR